MEVTDMRCKIEVLVLLLFPLTMTVKAEIGESVMVNIPEGIVHGTDPDFGFVCLTNSRAFRIDSTEVSWNTWSRVYKWAVEHAYVFSSDINGVDAKGSNYPVHGVTFFEALLWCNARSEMDGNTVCYVTTNGVAFRNYKERVSKCDFSASGYRLPTPKEWEFAARAGTCTRFYWGNTASHEFANYTGGTNSYDFAGNDTPHPSFSVAGQPFGSKPCTSPVASFKPNGFGVYDMAGNVSEWCWHNESENLQSSHYAILKGGSWRSNASHLRSGCVVMFESEGRHVYFLKFTGLRCVRGFHMSLE